MPTSRRLRAPTAAPGAADYDVVVVGARCAGATTAALLARRGHSVLLVDRARFPSDTVSTHALWMPGVVQLARLGVLDDVVASGTTPVASMLLVVGDQRLDLPVRPVGGATHAYNPRRTVLDAILVDAAIAAGADVRTGVTVTGLVRDRTGRVRGIRAHDASGVVFEAGLQAGSFPTNDGEACVFLNTPVADVPELRADVETGWWARMRVAAPDLARRLEVAVRTSRFTGSPGHASFFREPYGPGWALVGDAGYTKDPFSGHGITDALRDAELLADALDDALRGREPAATALERYRATRDDLARPVYEATWKLASWQWSPGDVLEVLGALTAGIARETELLVSRPPLTLTDAALRTAV